VSGREKLNYLVDMPSASLRPGHNDPHRRDIDGLRAVAILSVLGYHANSDWLPGGFVGVDVFFVISGYLISGIIFRGLQRGTFSFADFYARRVKRIFPALLIVLVLVTIFGWFSLFTDEYQALGKHVAAGAAFVSNVALWKEAGYFDPAAELKPLLHLWSLGIEEQFYLFWPPLFYFAWRRRINPMIAIIAITIGSFALNAYWVREHEVRTFYLPFTRIWELSLGSMLAYVQVRGRNLQPHLSERLGATLASLNGTLFRNVLAVLGVLLLVAAIGGITKYQQYPGWWAALPTLGTFLLIAAGSQTWVNRALLGNPVMVFFGLISYPLYLWHWPLLSFQRIFATGDIPTSVLILTLALAVVLAWLTYRFVERPIRSSPRRLEPSLTLVAGVALVGTIGYLSFAQHIQPRSAKFGLEQIAAASEGHFFPGPHLKQIGGTVNPIMAQGKSRQKVLFLGDSEIQQYYPRIDRLLTSDPSGTKSVIYSTRGGCPPIPHVRENHLPDCDGLIEQGIELARDPDVDTIVIATDWSRYFLGIGDPETKAYYFDDGSTKGPLRNAMGSEASNKALLAFESMIAQFTKAKKTVYIVLPAPTGVIFRPRSMITRSLSDLSFRIRSPNISTTSIVSQVSPIVMRLRQIAKNTGAITIDPIAFLCAGPICPVLTPQGEPVFRDATHINPEYMRQSVSYLDGVVRMIQTSKVPRTGSLARGVSADP
jgi:peptidoglycan/LPS O-acetylase OafA/YrhL